MKLVLSGKEFNKRLTVGTLMLLRNAGFDLDSLLFSEDGIRASIGMLFSPIGLAELAFTIFEPQLGMKKDELFETILPEELGAFRESFLDELSDFFQRAGRADMEAALGNLREAFKILHEENKKEE